MRERSVGQREQYNQNAYRSTLLQPSKQTYTIPKAFRSDFVRRKRAHSFCLATEVCKYKHGKEEHEFGESLQTLHSPFCLTIHLKGMESSMVCQSCSAAGDIFRQSKKAAPPVNDWP